MTTNLRKTVALIWLALPAFLLSALVHMADPDVGGWRGLWSYPVMWSVAVVGVLMSPCVWLCFGALMDSGRRGFLGAAALVSLCSGVVLTAVGSGATSAGGLAHSYAGSTALVFLVVVLAVVPAAAVGWPRTLSRYNGSSSTADASSGSTDPRSALGRRRSA